MPRLNAYIQEWVVSGVALLAMTLTEVRRWNELMDMHRDDVGYFSSILPSHLSDAHALRQNLKKNSSSSIVCTVPDYISDTFQNTRAYYFNALPRTYRFF